ncbi:unnamed protein product, partial [Prorocentrum cordatum]
MAPVRAVLAVAALAAAGGVQISGAGSAAERAGPGPQRGQAAVPGWLPRDTEVAGEKRGTLAEAGPPDTVVINATEGSVALPAWYGRMGNNILQLVNAILFCQAEGLTTLRLPAASNGTRPHSSSRAADMFDLPR